MFVSMCLLGLDVKSIIVHFRFKKNLKACVLGPFIKSSNTHIGIGKEDREAKPA